MEDERFQLVNNQSSQEIMSVNAVAVSLGLPIAAGAIGSGLKLAQQGFHKMLAAVDGSQQSNNAAQSAKDSLLSPAQQLEDLANGLRNWLHQHGIRLPYSITIGDQAIDQPQVEGSERERIADLLRGDSQYLHSIGNLLQNERMATPFGHRGRLAMITDLSSSIVQ